VTQPPDDEWPARDEDTVVSQDTVVQPPTGPPPDPEGRRIGYGMLLGILAVALVAGGALAVWLLTRDNDKKTTTVVVTTRPHVKGAKKVAVPRVVGLKEQEALSRLAEVGLRPKEVFKPTQQPKNVVVSQKPQEATEVKKGSQVTLVIDSGAPKVTVPDLKGQKVADAVKKLDALGLDSQQTQVTSTDPAGTVVDQAPPAGQKLAKGSAVTLSVSKAAPVAVPNVVGQSQADATSALQGAGFKVSVAAVPGTPNGQVTAQNPAAGSQAPKGSSVRINVANGAGGTTTATTTGGTTTRAGTTTAPQPANATVPDVQNTDLASAVHQLGAAGLLASIQYVPGKDPLGTILQQSPAAGQTVKTRSHVTINASSGPGNKPQKTVPNTVGQTLQQAVSTVNGAGLRLIFEKIPVTDRTQAGKVVEQTPLAGKTAPQNAQVLVYLGAFKS
jgi:beta-lactam-binding protein with PASTA domain